MNLREMRTLMGVRRPPAPHGERRLARCHSIDDLRDVARRRLPRAVMAYLDGGSTAESTLARNRSAFDEVEIVPRVLRDVSTVSLETTVLGQAMPMPIVLAPVGAPRLFHHEGELAVSRAAAAAGLTYAISTLATVPMERLAAATDGPFWFQLYAWRDHGVARELIARAREAGFEALVLTVDTTVRSKRERELRWGVTLPATELTLRSVIEGARHPNWWTSFLSSPPIRFSNLSGPESDLAESLRLMSYLGDGSISWDDLDWIRSAWNGPVVLKGIVAPEDARAAAAIGVDGIVVSNHGGRQLDHVPATIEALPPVVDAVGGDVEVLVDSGFRRGTDVLVALALGATACLVGRAYLYGLAAAGEAGVRHAIDVLSSELRTAMALAGAASVSEIDRTFVRRRGDWHL